LLRGQGQLAASVKDCYQAIELKPADPAAYLCRAEFYIASGAPQPAIADINQALMNGQNPAQASAMLNAAKQILEVREGAAQQATAPQAPSPVVEAVSAPRPVAASSEAAASVPVAALAPDGMPSPGTLPQSPAPSPAPPKAVIAPVPTKAQIAPAASVPAVPPPHAPWNAQAASSRNAQASHGAAVPNAANANSLYRQGRQYAEQERFADAVPLFDQAIQANPTFTQAYNARCYSYLRLKQYDQAIADCSEAIKLDPSYANAYQNRGVALHYKGDRAGGNEDLKRAAALQPVAELQGVKTTASKP